MAFPVFTLVTAILLIILIIVATLAIMAFQRRKDCFTYLSPWCDRNWQCAGTTTFNPVTSFQAVVDACKPINGQPNPQCKCAWDFYAPTNGGINTCTA
jgi:hypothetical protein